MESEMYPNNIIIDGARANDDQHWRIHRIHMIIGYAQALADIDSNQDYYKKIASIFDDKGRLFVNWNTVPTQAEKDYLKKAWESIVTDFESNDIYHELPINSPLTTNCRIPAFILSKIKSNAPDCSGPESYGRRGGLYVEDKDEAPGYVNICIYIQQGLAHQTTLLKEIAKSVFKIQSDICCEYYVYVFAYGDTPALQHEGKYFVFRSLVAELNRTKIAEALARISGDDLANPTVITELFPKKDERMRNWHKSKIDRGDLLIIIGNKDEVFLHKDLEESINQKVYKQILFVEIDKEGVNYYYRYKDFLF